jgi:hypothetical protein
LPSPQQAQPQLSSLSLNSTQQSPQRKEAARASLRDNSENQVPSTNSQTPTKKKKTKKAKATSHTPRGEIAYEKHLNRLTSSLKPKPTPELVEEKQSAKKKKKKKDRAADNTPPPRPLTPKTMSLKSQFISWMRSDDNDERANAGESQDMQSKEFNPFSDIVH